MLTNRSSSSLEAATAERAERLSRRCVDFLLTPGSLDPYVVRVKQAGEQVAAVATVAEAKNLETEIDASSSQLELLTETVSNLRIDDATKRTEIIDSIGDVFASLNRVRSSLKARVSELVSVEGKAEFASQLKLLEQTTAGYLDVCDSPERCDEYLTKIMVQLEELEGRFAEFDEFVVQLAQRREDVYAAFESRKVQLIEKRNRRAESLASAAARILKGIDSRVNKMESTDAIAAYFAGDLMVEKVRDIIDQLDDLDDAVRVEDLQSRLKTIREDATRQLKDRQDLYEDGGDVIRLGSQRFAVNTQPLDLTTVLRDGQMCLHLTGTQFFEPLHHEELTSARDLWNQELVSENSEVYRAEFLAVDLFEKMRGVSFQLANTEERLKDQLEADPAKIDAAWVQAQSGGRYDEGYAKGVHDVDAAEILAALVEIDSSIGLLRHAPTVRAAALLWFTKLLDAKNRKAMTDWIGGFAKLARAYSNAQPAVEFRQRLTELAEADRQQWGPLFGRDTTSSRLADYLFDELTTTPKKTIASSRAAKLFDEFSMAIPDADREKLLASVLKAEADPIRAFILARNWVDAFLSTHSHASEIDPAPGYRDELAWVVLSGGPSTMKLAEASIARQLNNLAGNHSRIVKGSMPVHYHELLRRVRGYREDVVPRFRSLHATKTRVVDEAREEMRLEEFKPRVLTSFVRNRLLDEVYLPLIGDNLAKQMGAAGEDKRTDRMGLLLLISPPGYGKTTLMEYIANRLGIVFMKINGPAIGHGVTSLDPAEAPNAAAREEIERLNLALEMGDNVMLYLDDIQHTQSRVAAEIHFALRRDAEDRRRAKRADSNLRFARASRRRCDGGQSLHRKWCTIPDSRHAV